MRRARTLIVVAAIAAMGVGGQVGCSSDRRIFITSDPSGARVYLNDQDVGVTPLEVNFTWFGVYDVRVRKEGYEPLVTTREAKAPLHETPPFDLVAMAVPGKKTTEINWHFDLEPAHEDPSELLARADELRARLAQIEKREELEEVSPGDETATTPPESAKPAKSVETTPGEGVREITQPPAEEPRGAPGNGSDVREVKPGGTAPPAAREVPVPTSNPAPSSSDVREIIPPTSPPSTPPN